MSALPPAPPKPKAPSHFSGDRFTINNDQHNNDNSDNESCFSAMPAPPPPVTNFIGNSHGKSIQPPRSGSFRSRSSSLSSSRGVVTPPKKPARKVFDDEASSVVSARSYTNNNDDDDDDDRKSDFYMPPPPPPVVSQDVKALDGGAYSSDESADDGRGFRPPQDDHEAVNKRRNSIDAVQRFVNQNAAQPNDGRIGSIASSSPATEIYYPKSYHHQNVKDIKDAKKKSLFSRLKSKLLLPSKGDIGSPTIGDNPTTANKRKKEKGKKQQQRPLSAADFHRNTDSRSKLKASISQPDLVTALQYDNVDGSNSIRKFDSMDGSSFTENCVDDSPSNKNKSYLSTPTFYGKRTSLSTPDLTLTSSPPSPSFSNSSALSNMKQLPRILSFRKSSDKSTEKKNKKKARRNSRQNVSPPRTPPPPPPSASGAVDSTDFGPFSPYDVIPSPTSDDNDRHPHKHQDYNDQLESPYEVIDKFRFSTGNGEDQQSNNGALSESSGSASQGRCSYAAEGPSSILKETADDCSFENVLERNPSTSIVVDTNNRRNSFNLNNNIVDKPPPPPPPMRTFESSLSLTPSHHHHSGRVSGGGPAEEIGIIEPEEEDDDNVERPSLKKRGSSLLSLNFPPPPDNQDGGEQNSPIATSSVENSFEISDEDNDNLLSPGLDSPDLNVVGRGRKDTTLSERDRDDPKLKPFIMSGEYQDPQMMLSPRNAGASYDEDNDNDNDDDASDWGSEFSSSVVVSSLSHQQNPDRQKQQQLASAAAAATSRYASKHRANMFNVSIKTSSNNNNINAKKKKEKTEEMQNTKKKNEGSSSKRKSIFSNNNKQQQQQRTQSQENKDVGQLLRPKTANKEKRKQVKSLPANLSLPNGKGDLGISQPVLVKRQTFAEIFSAKEVRFFFCRSYNYVLHQL